MVRWRGNTSQEGDVPMFVCSPRTAGFWALDTQVSPTSRMLGLLKSPLMRVGKKSSASLARSGVRTKSSSPQSRGRRQHTRARMDQRCRSLGLAPTAAFARLDRQQCRHAALA